MKFYDCKTAPSPRRVRIFMAEKGLDIETVQGDLASGEQLADQPFVAGATFSIADISAMVLVDFAKWIKIEVPDELAHVKRWYAEVSSRPSAAA